MLTTGFPALNLHAHLKAIASEQRKKEKSPPFLQTPPVSPEGRCLGNVAAVLAPACFPRGTMGEGCGCAFILGAWP